MGQVRRIDLASDPSGGRHISGGFQSIESGQSSVQWIKGGGSDRNVTDRKEIHPQVVATISRPVNIKGNGMKVQILDLGPNAHVDEHTVTYIRKSRAHALGLTKRFHKGT